MKKLTVLKIGENFVIFDDYVKEGVFEPGKMYFLDWNRSGMFFKEESKLSLPPDYFDEDNSYHKHILKTFNNQSKNVGVLFQGYKGTGKTVSAKALLSKANLPIFVISKSIPIDIDFVPLLSNLEMNYILFIDEFEKIFSKKKTEDEIFHSENVFLSFMDGIMSNAYKRLFVLTSNEDVGAYFMNRPSRIRYFKKYESISDNFYHHLIDNFLKYPEYKNDLVESLDPKFITVDILKSIIEEINIHNIPYSKFKDFFNNIPISHDYIIYRRNTKTDTFEHYSEITLKAPIKVTDTYITGIGEGKFEEFSENEIIFVKSTREYVDEDDDNNNEMIFTKQVYRIKKNLFIKLQPGAVL